jgi:hypothetical protein
MSQDIKITVKCACCGNKKIVGREQKDLPMCDRCYSPMFAEKVKIKGGGR